MTTTTFFAIVIFYYLTTQLIDCWKAWLRSDRADPNKFMARAVRDVGVATILVAAWQRLS